MEPDTVDQTSEDSEVVVVEPSEYPPTVTVEEEGGPVVIEEVPEVIPEVISVEWQDDSGWWNTDIVPFEFVVLLVAMFFGIVALRLISIFEAKTLGTKASDIQKGDVTGLTIVVTALTALGLNGVVDGQGISVLFGAVAAFYFFGQRGDKS